MTTLLIIEDDLELLASMQHTLQRNGFKILTAPDGLHGLELALKEHPDLIICDIMMPYVSGYEVLAELRSRSETSGIPFIFLTALDTPEDVREGMARGADDYLPKPFKQADLLHAIRARIDRQNQYERQRLQRYAEQLVSLQEDRQREIAQYLHENIAQHLASLKLSLSAQALSAQQQALINDLLDDIRALAGDVYPLMLERLGLRPAIQWLCDRFQRQDHLHIELSHTPLPEMSSQQSLFWFRMVQDTLSLLARHAPQTRVKVWMRAGEDTLLRLEIEAPQAALELGALQQDIEIITIYERATALPADLAFSSSVQGGFFLTIASPREDLPPPVTRAALGERLRAQTAAPPRSVLQVGVMEYNPYLRQGIAAMLDSNARYNLAYACGMQSECLAHLAEALPDVLLVNPFSGYNTPQGLHDIRERYPDLAILVFAAPNEPAYVVEAFRAGADGYLPHIAPPQDLLHALQTVAGQGFYLSPTITSLPLDDFLAQHENAVYIDTDDEAYHTLTPREREVFKLVAEGNTNAAIAHMLTISVRTVEAHRANLMRKLSLNNQNDLFRLALKVGVLSMDD